MHGGVASAEEKKWHVSKSKDGTIVFVEINGEVTHGDSLTFWLKKKDGKCDILQETFAFYSMHKNPNFKNL